jgi:hypothetical protein
MNDLRTTSLPIEDRLEQLSDHAEKYEHIRRGLFALRYYLQTVIRESLNAWKPSHFGATNYATLLTRVETWRVDHQESLCLVTFNYDTLLDDAFRATLGLGDLTLDRYIAEPKHKLIKVHGSIDWLRLVSGLPTLHRRGLTGYADVASSVANIQLVDDYRMTRLNEVLPQGHGGVPAIAVPTQRKKSFECPDDHLAALKAAIPEVSHLLIIGWRGNEDHFLNLWREVKAAHERDRVQPNLRKLLVVSSSDDSANEISERFAAQTTYSYVRRAGVGGGFTKFLQSNQLEQFLPS